MIAVVSHSYKDRTGFMGFDQTISDQLSCDLADDKRRFGGDVASSRVWSCVSFSAVSGPVGSAVFPVAKALFAPLSSLSSLSAALLLDLLLLRGPWAIR